MNLWRRRLRFGFDLTTGTILRKVPNFFGPSSKTFEKYLNAQKEHKLFSKDSTEQVHC